MGPILNLTALLVLVGIGALIFWIFQVITLMRLPDAVFPGRYDKAIWAAILILTFVLGAMTFWFWKVTVLADDHVEQTAGEIGRIIQEAEDNDETP